VLADGEEIATVPEYVPGAIFGLTDAVIEVGVAPPPFTVNQLSPLFRIAAAAICPPDGVLKTEIPWAASAGAPCWDVKLREVGETVSCACTFRVTKTEARPPWLERMVTVPV
jgi:hypothetical protein